MPTSKNTPKKVRVLRALTSGRGVTRENALSQFGVENLRATIADLRNNDGHLNIKTNFVKVNGKKIVKYTMPRKKA